MPTPSYIQVPPDNTGKAVATFLDSNSRHVHASILVDADGNPIADELRRIRRLLELLVTHFASEERTPE